MLENSARNTMAEPGKLRLYVDFISQPSRAVLIFCRVNNIPVEIHMIKVHKGEHKTPEFIAINPMGQVPAIDDGGFKLFESHSILRYLACSRPGVADHWYPKDVKRRAEIDCVLDWHHSNLRRGSAQLVLNRVLAPRLGIQPDMRAASEGEKLLKKALDMLETVWLQEGHQFLAGGSQPSIADLSLSCEVQQLQMLDKEEVAALLGPKKRIAAWVTAVENATEPDFAEVHKLLYKAAMREQERRDKSDTSGNNARPGSTKVNLVSKY